MNKKSYLILPVIMAASCGLISMEMSGALGKEAAAFENENPYRETKGLETDVAYDLYDWTGGIFPEYGEENIISEYDRIIREISSENGHDWRLISAIAYAESRFDHGVVSGAGAVGLMQIMPAVAKQFKADINRIKDPRVNITLGIRLLDYIGESMRIPDSTSEKDRLGIILASYNCGIGHVIDARRLAVKHGENPNSWNVVARYLKLKGKPEYYEDEVVRCGRFGDNLQTLGFVKKVMRYYDSYCKIAML